MKLLHSVRRSIHWIIGSLLTLLCFTSCDSNFLAGSMKAKMTELETSSDGSLAEKSPSLQKSISSTPARLMTSRQYFKSFLSVTGIQKPNDRLLSRYQLVRSVLPSQTDLSLLNAPIAMGLTNLAGATCEQMYDDEIQRPPEERFFLTGNDSEIYEELDIQAFSNRMALAAWGEPLSANERALFDQYYLDFERDAKNGEGQKRKSKTLLVSVCTAIMTAPKSIVF